MSASHTLCYLLAAICGLAADCYSKGLWGFWRCEGAEEERVDVDDEFLGGKGLSLGSSAIVFLIYAEELWSLIVMGVADLTFRLLLFRCLALKRC
jgi:hypothetical protein